VSPAEILHAVERAGVRMWWNARERMLCIDDVSPLATALDVAITQNVRPLIALVSRIGCRVGYRHIRTRYHVVVMRVGYLETACGVHLIDGPAPLRKLPDYDGPDTALCARCIRALVNRELARVDAQEVTR
jgi:hypothetical protein